MSIDTVFLLAAGALAILAGVLVIFMSPSRLASLLTGVALFLLGVQQIGWARAIDAVSWGERNYWLDLSFVCAPPVSLAWLLLSVTLGRGHGAERFRGWRVYVPVQALVSLATVAGLHWYSAVGRSVLAGGDRSVSLTFFGNLVIANLFVNITLLTANFEATYLAFSNRCRRAFRPAFLAIVLCVGTYGAIMAGSVLMGRVSLREIALASVPVALVSIIVPFSFLRRRVVEATVTGPARRIHETASFFLGAMIAVCLFGLNQLMHLTGWTLARASWVFIICAVLVGLGAVALSSRLQRLLQRLLEPYLYASHIDLEAAWTRLSHELDDAETRQDLFRMIPAKTAEIAGIKPVTLFAADPDDGGFVVVASTIAPWPAERVAIDEPLARELRAARHAIYLRGRADDLDYIPIYVENAKQIAACEAACAVPLAQKNHLIGFLLCGNPEEGNQRVAGTLLLLEIVAQMVTSRLTSLEHRG